MIKLINILGEAFINEPVSKKQGFIYKIYDAVRDKVQKELNDYILTDEYDGLPYIDNNYIDILFDDTEREDIVIDFIIDHMIANHYELEKNGQEILIGPSTRRLITREDVIEYIQDNENVKQYLIRTLRSYYMLEVEENYDFIVSKIMNNIEEYYSDWENHPFYKKEVLDSLQRGNILYDFIIDNLGREYGYGEVFNNKSFNIYLNKQLNKADILGEHRTIKLMSLIKEILKEEEKAYHGTSHFFKCFRTAYMGFGSGAQSYGWGIYFGKDVEIAKGYKGAGAQAGAKNVLFQGKTPDELGFEYDNDVFFSLPANLSTAKDYEEYANDMIEIGEEIENTEMVNKYKRFKDIIKELNVETEALSYVYEVILHKGKSPDQYEYLDWDASKTPQNQVDKINKQAEKENLDFTVTISNNPQGIYRNIIEEYFKAKGAKQPDKETSLFLLRAGIDGNTHSGGKIRIIFDEKAITIVNVCKK